MVFLLIIIPFIQDNGIVTISTFENKWYTIILDYLSCVYFGFEKKNLLPNRTHLRIGHSGSTGAQMEYFMW